jgi:hypothetical protein
MGEVGFPISSSQVLTVRLDPTDVRGIDRAGQPILHLPLKVRALPVSQAGDYALLRLAGRLLSSTAGDFAGFDAGPLALESRPAPDFGGTVQVFVDLDRTRVKRFEDARAGQNAHLQAHLSALIWVPGQSKFNQIASAGNLDVWVPKSHWADEVVTRWNLSRIKTVEIEFPRATIGENFRSAYEKVENAEKLFTEGHYKQTLAELYSAFENLAHGHGFKQPDQALFADLLADAHGVKKEKAKLALDKLCDFLQLGRHEPKELPETFEISRREARLGLTMAYAVFEYLAGAVGN